MNKHLRVSLSLSLLILVFAAGIRSHPPAPGPVGSIFANTLTGYVFTKDRQAVPDIYLELQNEVSSTVARVRTNGSGRYIFNGLTSGRFNILVRPYGTDFEEQSVEIEFLTVGIPGRTSPPQTIQQDFYLKVRRSEADKRAVTGTIFVQEVPEDARKQYQLALTSFEQKDPVAAMTALNLAIKLFPDYVLALERLGEEYARQNEWDVAFETYERVVKVNQRGFKGWYGLSFAAFGFEKYERSVEAAKQAVSIKADSTEALLMLGLGQRKLKQYQDAERSLKLAEKFSKGGSPDVHWNLALLYAHNLNNPGAAADQLELYLKSRPDAPNADGVRKLISQFRAQAGNKRPA